jgi:hypothetical protein
MPPAAYTTSKLQLILDSGAELYPFFHSLFPNYGDGVRYQTLFTFPLSQLSYINKVIRLSVLK